MYAEVKAWIAQQEAFEKATKTPAPLTNAQRKALEVLRLPLSVTPPPELGHVDYISLLNRYRQANYTGQELDWDEREASTKAVGGAIGRICSVTITESRKHPEAPVESFPAPGYGFEKGESPPVFPRKKDAKQYAAKCAVEWLIAQSMMPSNLRDVTFPKAQLPSRLTTSSFSRRLVTTSSDDEDSDEDSEDDSSPSSPPGSPSPAPQRPAGGTSSPGAVDLGDESLPATQRVTALCAELGIRAPRYVTNRSASGRDRCFDGYPDFGHDSSSMPKGLGRVEDVEGQEKARLAVAALVLEHLLCQYKERQSQIEDVLGSGPGGAEVLFDE